MMCMHGPNNVGRAVQTDPTLSIVLCVGDHGTKEK